MNHLIAFRALLFQSKYHLIFKTDKISNILGLNLLKLRKFKLRPKKNKNKNKKDKFVKFGSGLHVSQLDTRLSPLFVHRDFHSQGYKISSRNSLCR